MFLSIGMLKLNYFLADIFILSAEKQPIKLSWRKIECLQFNAMSKQQATFDDFFSECYLKYREYIKNYIALRICRPYEAEDLAQDVFVRLWEYRTFVNPDTVWSLLFTIARNIVTDQIRRYYKQEDFVAYIYNKVNDSDRNTTEDVICYRELKEKHEEVVKSLPAKRRRIYELSFNHELSCPAIAGKLSLSPRTVECQLLLARKTVRGCLRNEFSQVG